MAEKQELTVSQKQVVDNLCFERSGTAELLTIGLDQIAALDQVARGKVRTFGALLLATLFVTAICLAIHSVIPTVISAVALIAVVNRWMHWRKFDVPDERYLLAKKVIEMLGRDMSDDSPISLKLKFSSVFAAENEDKTRLTRYDRKLFSNEWLNVRGRFADGTKYSLRLTQYAVQKFRKGKRKAKGIVVSLILIYPQKKYAGTEWLKGAAMGAVKLPPNYFVKSVRVSENVLRLSTKIAPDLHQLISPDAMVANQIADDYFQLITMMFLSSYQILNLGRTLNKTS